MAWRNKLRARISLQAHPRKNIHHLHDPTLNSLDCTPSMRNPCMWNGGNLWVQDHVSLSLSLSNRPPGSKRVLVIGWCCSSPGS